MHDFPLKLTFEKRCKYCDKVMFVETMGKERCFDCKMKRQKEYNLKKRNEPI